MLGKATDVDQFLKDAEEKHNRKIQNGQKKIAEAQKLVEAILSDGNKEGEEDSDGMSARNAAMEAFRLAATEKDPKKAEALLHQNRGMMEVTTKASKKIGALNGRLSDMEAKFQALLKENAQLKKGKKRSREDTPAYTNPAGTIMSPSGLAKEAAEAFLGGSGEGTSEDGAHPTEQEIAQKAIELNTFASRTWKRYSTDDDSVARKRACPFHRKDFGDMIPLGEDLALNYAYNIADQFGWVQWGMPTGRAVMSKCFSGGLVSKTLSSEDYEKLDELHPVMPQTNQYTPYTNEQAKMFGLRKAE